jgi:hypothetical protein
MGQSAVDGCPSHVMLTRLINCFFGSMTPPTIDVSHLHLYTSLLKSYNPIPQSPTTPTMARTRGKKTAHLRKQPSYSTTSDEPVHTPRSEAPAQTYTNIRTPTSDTDTVVEPDDAGSIPVTFKAKKRARLSCLPENGVECVIDGVTRLKWRDLTRMGLDYLTIPAMSAEPERVISAVKITLSDRRCRMEDDTIEALECLKSSQRHT